MKHSKLLSPTLQEQKTHVEPASNRHFKIQMSLAGTVQGLLDSKFKLLKVEQTTNIKCLRMFARHFPDKPYVCNSPFFHMFGQTRKFHNATHNPSTFYMLVQNNEQYAISVGSFRYAECGGNVVLFTNRTNKPRRHGNGPRGKIPSEQHCLVSCVGHMSCKQLQEHLFVKWDTAVCTG